MSHVKRILSRVRIHGGDSGVSARATHHNVQGFISEQAELRTVRNSTTERKKMSTKTTFKRIALGTVAALATSLLTVVAVPSASAGASAVTAELAAAGSNSAITAVGDGNCLAYKAADDLAVINRLVRDSINVDFGNTLAIDANVNHSVVVELTGPGAFTTPDSASAPKVEKNGAGTTVTQTGDATAARAPLDLTIKTSGTGTIVVKVSYNAAGTITPITTLTVEVNTACPTVAYNAAKSSITLATEGTAITAQNLGGDSAGASSRLYSETGYVKLWLADQYGTQVSSVGAYLEVSATNGAFVKFDGTPVATTDVTTTTIHDAVVSVKNGPSGTYKPVTTTVTIKANGTVIGTKTITFTGVAASVTVSDVAGILAIGQTDSIRYVVKDAAGNQIAETAEAGASSANVNGASVANSVAATDTVAGTATLSTGGTEGATETTLRITADDGTVITSAPIKFLTSTRSLDTFTVALDKKTYAPGEVVTLTVTGKNAKGNLVADGAVLGTSTIVPTGLTAVGDTLTPTTASVNGAWTVKYYASTTPASYGVSVKATAATTTDAVSTTFNVVSAGSSEIAQLVKVIGNLLTTFTKQITALIKALKR
jgi:trimeric autotransporter adhesin